jgi:hypothetical protein
MPNIDISSLSAAELEQLIADAAKLRMAIQPTVAAEPPENSEGVHDPAWRSFMMEQHTILQLRHPGLGWVTFAFPPHERANLLTLFLRHALTPAAAVPSGSASSPLPKASGGSTVH